MGDYIGDYIGHIKGVARSLDNGSFSQRSLNLLGSLYTEFRVQGLTLKPELLNTEALKP